MLQENVDKFSVRKFRWIARRAPRRSQIVAKFQNLKNPIERKMQMTLVSSLRFIRRSRTLDMVNKWRAALLVMFATLHAAPAIAQQLPASTFVSGKLVSPAAAFAYYGSSTTHSSTINLFGSAINQARPAEIKELAKGLGSLELAAGTITAAEYAQRAFQYVNLNIETTFTFGLSKGAYGALVDQSGNPFDQTSLLIELLREAGIAASYQVGTITISATDFGEWTGLVRPVGGAPSAKVSAFTVDAKAACRLLADGGIPAIVNGTTDSNCNYTGNLSSVTIAHVWASALAQNYDPSFKRRTIWRGADLAAAMQCGSGTSETCSSAARSAATSTAARGILSGTTNVNYIQNVNYSSLNSTLTSAASNLQAYVETNLRHAERQELTGGSALEFDRVIAAASMAPIGASAQTNWSGDVPDQYRTRFSLAFDNILKSFWADEIAGRRLRIFGVGGVVTSGTSHTRTATLYLEFEAMAASTRADADLTNDDLQIAADYPYAGTGGLYMDTTIVRETFASVHVPLLNPDEVRFQPLTIVHQFGTAGPSTLEHASKQQQWNMRKVDLVNPTSSAHDVLFDRDAGYSVKCFPQNLWSGVVVAPNLMYLTDPGCIRLHEPTNLASILGQDAEATTVIGDIASVAVTTHHVIGSMSGGATNMEPARSIVSANSSAADEKGARLAMSLVGAWFEGGIYEQSQGEWEGQSGLSYLIRSNDKSQKLLYVNSSNVSAANANLVNYSVEEKSLLSSYAGGAYSIVAPQDGHAGSFSFGSATITFLQNGIGAFKADYSSVGALVNDGFKGSSPGGTDPLDATLNAARLAERNLKDREFHSVSISDGALAISPDVDLITGQGVFPDALSFSRTYSSSGESIPSAQDYISLEDAFSNGARNFSILHIAQPGSVIGGGWSHNFELGLSMESDGFQGMGGDSALDAVGFIAGAYALAKIGSGVSDFDNQVAALFTAHWTGERLNQNVVSVKTPNVSGGFVRLPNGKFNPPPGHAARLVQTGVRAGPVASGTGTIYDYSPVTFLLTDETGGTFNFDLAGVAGYSVTPSYLWTNLRRFKALRWNLPDGKFLDFAYDRKYPISKTGSGLSAGIDCLRSVTNHFGRKIELTTGIVTENGVCQISAATDEQGRTVQYSGVPITQHNYALNSTWSPFTLSVTRVDGTVEHYDSNSNAADATVPSVNSQVTAWRRPSTVGNYLAATYDTFGKVTQVTDGEGRISKYRTATANGEEFVRAAAIDSVGATTATYASKDGRALRRTDPLGEITAFEYDSAQRVVRTTAPDGRSETREYDLRSNVVRICSISNTRAGQPCDSALDIATSFTFPETGVFECANAKTCNSQISATDSKGNVTNYTYFSNGLLKTVTAPPDVSGVRGITSYAYGSFGQLTSRTDPLGVITSYSYYPVNTASTAAHTFGELQKVTLDSAVGGLGIETQFAYNSVGDVTQITDPRGFATSYQYDPIRRLTDAAAPLGALTKQFFDLDGRITSVERATGDSVNPWATTSFTYDKSGRLKTETDPDGKTSYGYYDAAGQLIVTVDAEGRKTRTVYDAAGRVLKVIKAWAGSNSGGGATTNCAIMRSDTAADPTKLQQCYQEYVYTPSGKIASVRDAKGNKTTYVYDGYDRLDMTQFPSKTAVGLSDPADYEDYDYDANGNMISKRARDGRTITFVYDALNRLTQRTVPGSGDASGNYETFDFTYDLAGRQLTNNHWGTTILNAYDAAGRLVSKKHNNAKPLSYDYDPAGNVTHLTYPDGFVVRYTYDALNRTERVQQVNAPTDTGYIRQFAHVGYDAQSRRTFLRYLPNSFSTAATYGYSPRGYLLCQEWNFAGTRPPQCDAAPNANAPEIAWDFAHNGVGQLISETVSDPLQGWRPATLGTDAYASNGLNQYTSIDGAAIAHDGNGNTVTDHRGRAYAYSAENQLYTVYGGATLLAQNVYYGDGNRRYVNSTSGGVRRFYYDGDQEIAEYNAANTNIVRRYIRLPGSVDEPLLMIDYSLNAGCTLTSDAACQRWAHQNRLGSVVAVTDSAGNVVERHKYGPYGEVGGSTSGFPFRFTGQKLDPETGLYYYKARFYDPDVGRFLQIDPIGYADQMNLYAYVGNDPSNFWDPTGTRTRVTIDCAADAEELGLTCPKNFDNGTGKDQENNGERRNSHSSVTHVGSSATGSPSGGGFPIGGGCDPINSPCLPSALAAVVLAATILTPIPGDEFVLGSALLRGGSRLAGRSGRFITRAADWYVDRKGVARNATQFTDFAINKAFRNAAISAAPPGAVAAYGGYKNTGRWSNALACGAFGAGAGASGSLLLTAGRGGAPLGLLLGLGLINDNLADVGKIAAECNPF